MTPPPRPALDATVLTRLFDWQQKKPGRPLELLNRSLARLRFPYRLLPPVYTGTHTNVERRVNIFHLLGSVLTQGVPGDVVELGCNKGQTSVLLQHVIQHYDPSRTLHVFDSFRGLPPPVPQDGATPYEAGTMSVPPDVLFDNFRKHALPHPVIHAGWFEDTLPTELPARIAFAYLDGDFYASILVSLQHTYPRLSTGAVCVIDDYCDPAYSDWNFLPGVKRACDEFFADRQEKVAPLYAGYAAQGYFRKL